MAVSLASIHVQFDDALLPHQGVQPKLNSRVNLLEVPDIQELAQLSLVDHWSYSVLYLEW